MKKIILIFALIYFVFSQGIAQWPDEHSSKREVFVTVKNKEPKGFLKIKVDVVKVAHGVLYAAPQTEPLNFGDETTFLTGSRGFATGADMTYKLSFICESPICTDHNFEIKMQSYMYYAFSDENAYDWFYYPDNNEDALNRYLNSMGLNLVKQFYYYEKNPNKDSIGGYRRFVHNISIEPFSKNQYHIKTVNDNPKDTVEVSFSNYGYGIVSLDKDKTTCDYQGNTDQINITYQLKNNQSCDIYLLVENSNISGKLNIAMKNLTDSKKLLDVTAEKDGSNLKVTNFEIHGNTGTSAGLTPDKFEQESEIDYK